MENKHVQRSAGVHVLLFKFSCHISTSNPSNQTVLACAGISVCSLIFVFLSNVKQPDCSSRNLVQRVDSLTYDIYISTTSCKLSMSLRFFLPLHRALIACIFLVAVK